MDLDPAGIQINVSAHHLSIVLAMLINWSDDLWSICVRRGVVVAALTGVGDPHPPESSTMHL